MSEGTTEEDRRVRGEGELTSQLIVAARDAQGPLSQQEIDAILGVEPGERSV